jgi:hypothetical protein
MFSVITLHHHYQGYVLVGKGTVRFGRFSPTMNRLTKAHAWYKSFATTTTTSDQADELTDDNNSIITTGTKGLERFRHLAKKLKYETVSDDRTGSNAVGSGPIDVAKIVHSQLDQYLNEIQRTPVEQDAGASIPPKGHDAYFPPPPEFPFLPCPCPPFPSLLLPFLPHPIFPLPSTSLPLPCPSFPSLNSLLLRFLGIRRHSPRKIFVISQMLVGELHRILNPINMHLDISFFACTFAFSSSCHLVWCVRVYVCVALTRVHTL